MQGSIVGKADDISEVREIMGRLGVTPNYKGFYYTVYAVCLVADKPERLLLVTKWLYPEVARHYETTVNAVERDIRTVSYTHLSNSLRSSIGS